MRSVAGYRRRRRERPRLGLDDGRAPGATAQAHDRRPDGHVADHARHIPAEEGTGADGRLDRASRRHGAAPRRGRRASTAPRGGPNLPQLEADPARLEQVIYNLLTNAFKFTPLGGRVEFSVEAERGELVLAIRDTGRGIAPAFLAHIFEPFAQAETTLARGRSGLGIGLTLVKAIVELHGGSVEARSAGLNRGCEIVVRLPTVGADDDNGSGPSSL